MAIGLVEASLFCIVLEALLFGESRLYVQRGLSLTLTDRKMINLGVFNVLVIAALYVVIYKRRNGQPINVKIVSVAVSMYIVAFAVRKLKIFLQEQISDSYSQLKLQHIVVVMRRSVIGFVQKADEPGGAYEYFFRTSDPSYLLENSLYFVQTVIGDSFVVRSDHSASVV